MPKFIFDDDDSSSDLKKSQKNKAAKKRKVLILDDSDKSNEYFPPVKMDNNKNNEILDSTIDYTNKNINCHSLQNITKKKPKINESGNSPINLSTTKSTNTMKHYFMAMNREPPKKLGSRSIPTGKSDCLEGLTFVITGILDLIERDDAINLIKRHGGKVTSSVSGKTSYVVLGREAGPAKLEKIKKLRIKTIDDEGLFQMIEKHPIDAYQPHSTLSTMPSTTSIKDEPAPIKDPSFTFNNTSTIKDECISLDDTKKTVPSVENSRNSIDTILWVDKYRPTSVKNLVGQHGPNSPANKLLKWLQSWDPQINGSKKATYSGKDDGKSFKAALLSGKPGLGKTTTAILCCKELGLDYVELNASDTRNRSLLKNIIKESTQSGSFSYVNKDYFTTTIKKHVIIMDEVDGISGNQDRGGLSELVSTIKSTRVPIICICNDRSNQKIRTLANYCYDLRFQRPRIEQIKAFCSTIAFREKLNIQPQALNEIIAGADQDIRQVLNRLQMWASTKSSFNFDDILVENKNSYKDTSQNVFDAVRQLLNYTDSRKMSVNEKLDLFFTDYSIMPLFMQENYILCYPSTSNNTTTPTVNNNNSNNLQNNMILKVYSTVCDLLALSTITDNIIRSSQSWSLLPTHGILSCVLPSCICSGVIQGMINFPQWLGRNSSHGKNERYLDQLNYHTRVSTYTNRKDLILDYIPYIHRSIVNNLLDSNCVEDGSLENSVEIMKHYNLMREDWDLINELEFYDGLHKNTAKIPSKTLSSFTRTLNKMKRILPYTISQNTKKSVKAAAEELLRMSIDDEVETEQDSSDEQSDMIKQVVVSNSNTTSRKRSSTVLNSNIKTDKRNKKSKINS